MPSDPHGRTRQHERIVVTGKVQGVGFRPFVYQLATELGLSGWVWNQAGGVTIDLTGQLTLLSQFRQRLLQEKPRAAEIESLSYETLVIDGEGVDHNTSDHPRPLPGEFRILESESPEVADNTRERIQVPADLRVCEQCLQEMLTPTDRRYRYPFINCTQCGPRYTLIKAMPYDRSRTSMAAFRLCAHCEREFRMPSSRRFHAQPNACSVCGPHLQLYKSVEGEALPVTSGNRVSKDVINELLILLQEGHIVALKGLGGFHLMCDARNPEAIMRLRQRKQRPHKPLAVMGLNRESLAPLVSLTADDTELLAHPEAPIVLARKKAGCDSQLTGIAPEVADLGVMTPYTPLHYLLFHEAAGRPEGSDWLQQGHSLLLVATSANISGEPLIYQNEEALKKLARVADYFVIHNREIVSRCDDSVLQGGYLPVMVRRARGWAPGPIRLCREGPSVLACGAYLKNSFCLTQGNQAYLSPHVGDLENQATCEAMRETLDHMLQLYRIRPDVVTCDLHPDFFSTHLAEEFAGALGVPLMRVQHHQAHIAAVMAEHGLIEPVLGVSLDGFGLGDGTALSSDTALTEASSIAASQAWGGELFYGTPTHFQRVGHLSTLPLPGGDRAAREVWRLGAGALIQKGMENEARERFGHQPLYAGLSAWIKQGNVATTSSAGRWFDAVAAILGIMEDISFEAQAAMALEALACRVPLPAPQQWLGLTNNGELDLSPMLAWLCQGAYVNDRTLGAARFHVELIDGLTRWIQGQSQKFHSRQVVLSGGCLLNRLLREGLTDSLANLGLQVYLPQKVPCNDGGISLGQAWIAMAEMNGQPEPESLEQTNDSSSCFTGRITIGER